MKQQQKRKHSNESDQQYRIIINKYFKSISPETKYQLFVKTMGTPTITITPQEETIIEHHTARLSYPNLCPIV